MQFAQHGAPEGPALLLLSCSHDKRAGGSGYVASKSVAQFLPKNRSALMKVRDKIRRLLCGEPPRLYGGERGGGWRDERPCNRCIEFGRDFGGPESTNKIYLPAHDRYSGRFFAQLKHARDNFWHDLARFPVEIVFVSGLYGLVLWDELIQEYDCHITDYTPGNREQTVAALWCNTRNVLSDCLSEFIAARRIRCVYDLLSEEAYQNLFAWGQLQGARVYHRVLRDKAGPDILKDLATIVATQLTRFYEGDRFRDQTEGHWYFADSIASSFELDIGDRLDARREGDLIDIREELRTSQPELADAPKNVRERMVLAEHSWRRVQNLRHFDFGALIVSYAKAVEAYLRFHLPSQRQPDKRSLKQLSQQLKEGERRTFGLGDLREKVDYLQELRGFGAHPDPKRPTREAVRYARDLTFEILCLGTRYWPSKQP
jgi:hypothetical protein